MPARTFLGLLPLWLLLVSTCSYVTMDEGMGIITEETYPVHGDNILVESTTCPIPKCIGTVVACIPLCFSPSKSIRPIILPSHLPIFTTFFSPLPRSRCFIADDACCRCLVRLDPSLDCCGCYWRKDGRFQSVCNNATCSSTPSTSTMDWVTLDTRTQDVSSSRRRLRV